MRWRFHGSDLFLQHILQVLDWIEILGIWRPCEHLKLIVVLLFAFWCPAVDTLGPKSSMVNMGTMNDLWKCSTIHNKLWCTVYSDMFSSVCSTTAHMLDRTTQASLRFPRASMTLLLVHHCSFVEPLGIDSDHYRLAHLKKAALTQSSTHYSLALVKLAEIPTLALFFFLEVQADLTDHCCHFKSCPSWSDLQSRKKFIMSKYQNMLLHRSILPLLIATFLACSYSGPLKKTLNLL